MPRKGGSLRREQPGKRTRPLDVAKFEREFGITKDTKFKPKKRRNDRRS
jgi:hypothetical protein